MAHIYKSQLHRRQGQKNCNFQASYGKVREICLYHKIKTKGLAA
jgi:hypothetical protein